MGSPARGRVSIFAVVACLMIVGVVGFLARDREPTPPAPAITNTVPNTPGATAASLPEESR